VHRANVDDRCGIDGKRHVGQSAWQPGLAVFPCQEHTNRNRQHSGKRGESRPAEQEAVQRPAEWDRYDDSTMCTLCGACTRSCPRVWTNLHWVGLASNSKRSSLHRRRSHRDTAERLRILSDYDGLWPRKTIFKCTEACPRGIPVTDTIEQVKRVIVFRTNEAPCYARALAGAGCSTILGPEGPCLQPWG
jgi:heterodisulfide reductase subunit C